MSTAISSMKCVISFACEISFLDDRTNHIYIRGTNHGTNRFL